MNSCSKNILALVLGSAFAMSAHAEAPTPGSTDSTIAAVEWTGGIPVVLAGEYTKITGLNGAPLVQGELDVNLDGSFGSKAGSVGQVITELHNYDSETETVGDILKEADATSISWSLISNPVVSSSGVTDTSSAKAVLTANTVLGASVMDMSSDPLTGTPTEVNRVSWNINSAKDGLLGDINQGDVISVSAMVQAETTF
ncbi:hypothetical protein A9D46_18275 [Photobacterium damselae subsp. damselae]|uniref:hypothetical protein n=1 Tax=Photobacterium damselae TaxID=38293 RepID=UPI00084A89B0|nr:hypothetical protein [Photobacterium damselae]OEC81381.1 hypothetical protein A9D46_18275 [Photobacterium damselae subsp. damselae]